MCLSIHHDQNYCFRISCGCDVRRIQRVRRQAARKKAGEHSSSKQRKFFPPSSSLSSKQSAKNPRQRRKPRPDRHIDVDRLSRRVLPSREAISCCICVHCIHTFGRAQTVRDFSTRLRFGRNNKVSRQKKFRRDFVFQSRRVNSIPRRRWSSKNLLQ